MSRFQFTDNLKQKNTCKLLMQVFKCFVESPINEKKSYETNSIKPLQTQTQFIKLTYSCFAHHNGVKTESGPPNLLTACAYPPGILLPKLEGYFNRCP